MPTRLVMLVAAGRRTGKMVSFPVMVAGYQGERYLVSMLGEGTNWADPRARGRRACCAAAAVRSCLLEAVGPGERAAILAATLSARRGQVTHPGRRPDRP